LLDERVDEAQGILFAEIVELPDIRAGFRGEAFDPGRLGFEFGAEIGFDLRPCAVREAFFRLVRLLGLLFGALLLRFEPLGGRRHEDVGLGLLRLRTGCLRRLGLGLRARVERADVGRSGGSGVHGGVISHRWSIRAECRRNSI
jgi:hypothetical protein